MLPSANGHVPAAAVLAGCLAFQMGCRDCPAAAGGELIRPLQKLQTQRIRGGYLGAGDTAQVEPAARAGLNAILVKFGGLEAPLRPESEKLFKQWADLCAKHGVGFWPVFNFFGGHEPKWVGQYRHHVTRQGNRLDRTPCPIDEDFWRRIIEARFVLLAELSRKYPMVGVILDLEMYGADATGYHGVCYSDYAIDRVLRAAGKDVKPPPPAERYAWLEKQGLLETYRNGTRQAVRQLAEHTRDAVDKIAPNLLLGAFHADRESPVPDGILLGLGRPGKPMLAYTEMTYSTGYTKYVQRAQRHFKALNAHAVLVCGIWQSKFIAKALPAHLYHCGRDSMGYWIYTLSTFGMPSYSPLPGDHAAYWAAFRRANDELDRLAADPTYRSALKIEPFVLPPVPLTTRGVKQLNLVPWTPPTGKPVPPVHLRGENILCFHAEKGQRVAMKIGLAQVGRYPDSGQYLLVSPDKRELARGDVKVGGKARELTFQAKVSGVYALVVGAGSNAIRIEGRHPYAVTTAKRSGASLVSVIPPLYILTRAGQREVRLTLRTQGGGEQVRAVIRVGDKTAFDEIVAGNKTAVVPVDPNVKPPVLRLETLRVPGAAKEDLAVVVEAGAYPFVATSPDGLLKSP